MLISVIVSTYNWPEALNLCLSSLLAQEDRYFEIVIADDGSNKDTKDLIDAYIAQSGDIKIYHAYQEDHGFRLSAIRNKATLASNGGYLIFLDGDCAVRPSFIKNHRKLMQHGHFVAGNRVLISEQFTCTIFNKKIGFYNNGLLYFFIRWLQRDINRLIPLITLPLGCLRTLQTDKWCKVLGCNIGVYKNDVLLVNGFDEIYYGWGYEDSDFAIRLINAGIKRKEGRFCVPVLHLWHTINTRHKKDVNYQRMIGRSKDKSFIKAEQGISQYGSAPTTRAIAAGHEPENSPTFFNTPT